MTLAEVKGFIMDSDTDTLDELIPTFKARRKQLRKNATRDFSVGDSVKFETRSGQTIYGEVLKVNRVNIKVDCPDVGPFGTTYKVPATLLEHSE